MTSPTDNSPDNPPSPSNGVNIIEYSVSELSFALKKTVEDTFGYVRVRGELGRVSHPASGHVYLDLKDDKAVMSGIIWKGVSQKLPIQPEQGLEVICTGRMTTFPGQSKYQLIIESMEPAGAGALMALLEERKKKLVAEGLFDPERKTALPYLPEVIGVVTSPSGAVIRDILHRLADRFPRRVLVWPVRVQGKTCAEEVARAIIGFNGLKPNGEIPRPDVLIVARGGGSLEDLWGFNEEIVVRTAAQSDIPLISAIGHETDTTLIDYAADRRAPTPTAAAEMAVPVRTELQAQIMDLSRRQFGGQMRIFENRRDRLAGLTRGLPRLDEVLALPAQRLDAIALRLERGLLQNVTTQKVRLDQKSARLNLKALSQTINQQVLRIGELHLRCHRAYENSLRRLLDGLTASARQLGLLGHESVLARGFALVLDAAGLPIRQSAQAPVGSNVTIQLADKQTLGAQVMSHFAGRATGAKDKKLIAKKPAAKKQVIKEKPAAKKTAKNLKKSEQGDLF